MTSETRQDLSGHAIAAILRSVVRCGNGHVEELGSFVLSHDSVTSSGLSWEQDARSQPLKSGVASVAGVKRSPTGGQRVTPGSGGLGE